MAGKAVINMFDATFGSTMEATCQVTGNWDKDIALYGCTGIDSFLTTLQK